jgi:hypothetical protein
MTREEAIAFAKDVAKQHRWVWTGEVKATFHKPIPILGWILRQRPRWRVVSNADDTSFNVVVTIDADRRMVLSKRFGSR